MTEFAKIAPAVSVVVVGGNHDEASRQVATAHDDSWDVDAAAAVADGATFDSPQTYPLGLPAVLVNGRLVVHNGLPTGDRPGVMI